MADTGFYRRFHFGDAEISSTGFMPNNNIQSGEYKGFQNFEGKQSDDRRFNHSTIKRLNADDDGLQCNNKRVKNVDGKSMANCTTDDGYKWCKYGQKSMANCTEPRCYYKCSSKKCSVKKRVERKALENEIVVVTYEGIHNHPCPNPVSYVERRVYLPMPCAATCQ